jgi:hypothetical protein
MFAALNLLTSLWLRHLGFRRYRTAAFAFWYRPGASPDSKQLLAPPAPVVFYPGMGVGLFPYIPFLMRIERVAACEVGAASIRRAMFLVELPFISMNMEEKVPSAAETVDGTVQMLERFGYTRGCFVVRTRSFATQPSHCLSNACCQLRIAGPFIRLDLCFLDAESTQLDCCSLCCARSGGVFALGAPRGKRFILLPPMVTLFSFMFGCK